MAKAKVELKLEKPLPVKKAVAYQFEGIQFVEELLPGHSEEIASYAKKFSSRYGVKLKFIPKFLAFKLLRKDIHVDWININDLMKRYDCRIPPVKIPSPIQRPYERKRVY